MGFGFSCRCRLTRWCQLRGECPYYSCLCPSDSLSVQRCLVFTVPMLPQQQEFDSDTSYLCLPPPPQYCACLHYAGTRHGRAAEKGMEGEDLFLTILSAISCAGDY